MRWRNGAAKSGLGPVRQRREGEQRLPGGAQRDTSEDRISCMHDDTEPTHDELVERLDKVAMVKGADGIRATLLTWNRRLGHPSFKTVVALAESGANGMVTTDLPEKIWVRCKCRSESSTLPA